MELLGEELVEVLEATVARAREERGGRGGNRGEEEGGRKGRKRGGRKMGKRGGKRGVKGVDVDKEREEQGRGKMKGGDERRLSATNQVHSQ